MSELRSPLGIAIALLLLVAAAVTLAAWIVDPGSAIERGMRRVARPGEEAEVVAPLSLEGVEPDPDGVLRWRGYWHRVEAGTVELHAVTNGEMTVEVDGVQVLTRRREEGNDNLPPRVRLDEGLTPLLVTARLPADGSLTLRIAGPDSTPRKLSSAFIFPRRYTEEEISGLRRSATVRRAALTLWIALALAVLARLCRTGFRALAVHGLPGRAAWLVHGTGALAWIALLTVWFRDPGIPGTNALRAWPTGTLAVPLLGVIALSGFVARRRLHRLATELMVALRLTGRARWTLAAGIAVAVVTLLPPLLWPVGAMDADTAISGLAGKHIADGRVAPAFYYGTMKSGTLSAHLVALRTVVAGASPGSLMEVTRLTYLALMAVMFCLLRLGFGTTVAGALVVWMALPPLQLAVFTTHNEYLEPLLFIATALLLASLILTGRLRDTAWWLVLGGVLGLGLWSNPLTAPASLAVATAWALDRRPRLARARLVGFGIGAALGFAPSLVGMGPDALGLAGFLFREGAGESAPFLPAVVESLRGTFTVSFPVLLFGYRHAEGPGTLAAIAACLLVGAALVAGIATARSRRQDPAPGATTRRVVAALLTSFLCWHLVMFWLSPFRSLVFPPRYLLPIYLSVMPLTALAICQLRARFTSGRGALAVGVAMLLLASPGFLGTLDWYRTIRVDDQAMKASFRAMLEAGVDHCEAPYWDAFRISHGTQEAILCNATDLRRVGFYGRMLRQRQRQPIPPFASDPGRTDAGQERRRWLEEGGLGFETVPTPYFDVVVAVPRDGDTG